MSGSLTACVVSNSASVNSSCCVMARPLDSDASTQVYTCRYTPEQAVSRPMSAPARQLLARPERQAAILRGAAAAFAQSGFAATSMEDVAAACGVTKLIVYRHFDSKEELYRTILER